MAKLIQVIEVEIDRGDGSESNPHRIVTQWWTHDGLKIAQRDPWAHEEIMRALHCASLVNERQGASAQIEVDLLPLRALVQ